MRMRIAHLLGWYFPESLGGTEIYVLELCRRLKRDGFDVAVAAPRAGAAREETYRHDGVEVFRYPIPAVPTRDEAQGVRRARGANALDLWLRSWNPDIVHGHSLVTGLGIAELAAAREHGARVVFTHHLPSLGYVCRAGWLMERGTDPCDGVSDAVRCATCVLTTRGMPPWAAKLTASVPELVSRTVGRLPGSAGTAVGLRGSIVFDQQRQRKLFAVADRQVVLNEASRRIFVANGLPVDRVVVNRLGLGHRTAIKPANGTQTPVRFGCVGRFDPVKGMFVLVRAVRMIPQEVNFSVDIRGPVRNDADRRVVADLQRAIGDDRRIVVAEGPAHADVPALLASYDVLCCPSIWFEHGPTIAIESLAVGTPLIVSRFGNLQELVDARSGRLVAPGDERELADALTDVALHPQQIDRWRAQLAPARTMDDVAAEYEAMYAALVRQGPGARSILPSRVASPESRVSSPSLQS